MSPIQMLWYSMNINQDESEQFELIKGFAEYMMSFVNPEAVKKIRESEAPTSESTVNPEDLISDRDSFIKDIEGLGLFNGGKETNNKNKLDDKPNLSGPLFDLTKDY
jgi:hypothetical protein